MRQKDKSLPTSKKVLKSIENGKYKDRKIATLLVDIFTVEDN